MVEGLALCIAKPAVECSYRMEDAGKYYCIFWKGPNDIRPEALQKPEL